MNILKEAHNLVLNHMAARKGRNTERTVRSCRGVFCPYSMNKDIIKIVCLKDLNKSLSFSEIEFAPIARDSSEYGISDPFAWIDRKYGISRAALQMLTQLKDKTKITIKTHSDLIACEEYRDVLKELVNKGHDVQIQLIAAWGLDPDSARILMPGKPSEKRLNNAFECLRTCGLNVIKVNLNQYLI